MTLLVMTLTPGLVSIAAEQDCQVELVQGWHTGAGAARITMRNTGKPCGGALYTIPQQKIAVDKIVVVVPPKNGLVTIDVPRFGYTPRAGFAGEDSFELTAEGPGRAKAERIALRGVVTVRVSP